MKSTRSPRFSIQRLFLLTLVSLVAVAALIGVAASANKANRAAKANQEQVANSANPVSTAAADKQRQAPNVVGISASLTDNVTPNTTKVAPGATVNYTALITSTGAVSPADDALNAFYNDVLDTNTTYVASSVHASPIAFNDTYNWVGNTQLDTTARALPAVTANDIAVNATSPAVGTDTFTVTTIAGGATSLSGNVSLAANGSFVYTPPVGRPNIADGASVTDSFTYTIKNSADATLTGTGTVNIVLTGRVWYLQAGAAGDGRSNTPSGSPSAMSTAADKSTDFFYIFSNAGSLNGPFSVDAGQQLLGQGVNLVVSAITLFTAAAPTPTTTNTAGSCVTLVNVPVAPGNNTLSGFNIGNCTGGTAITGANVGTLNVSTMTINTNGGALDLTGVGSPTVSVVLGGTTSTGGAKNVNLVGLNGTITLASGALSGATGNGFDVSGGTAAVTYSGTISNSGAEQVNVANKTGGSVALSGAISGTGTGINLTTNTGATMTFSGGITLSTGANSAFTATGGGTVNVTGTNTITTTTGTAVNIANTTIGGSNVTFQSVAHNGNNTAIILSSTGAGQFLITGTGVTAGSGGTIQNIIGADAITLNTTGGLVTLKNMIIQDITAAGDGAGANDTRSNVDAIQGQTVNGGLTLNNVTIQRISDDGINGSVDGLNPTGTVFNGLTVTNCTIQNTNRFNVAGHADAQNEAAIYMFGIKGTVSVTGSNFNNAGSGLDFTTDTSGSLDMTVQTNSFTTLYKETGGTASVGNYGVKVLQFGSLNSVVRIGDQNDANAALGNTFLNGGRLSAIEVVTNTGSTGTMKAEIARNTLTVTDHSSPGQPAGNTIYNFPQSGVLLRALGSGNYDGFFATNTLDQVMHANGGIGQLSLLSENGNTQFIVQNNTFKLPWDAPIELRADGFSGGQASCRVLFQNNTYVDGTVGDGTTDLGGQSPFDAFYAQARNNGRLDFTIKNEATALGLTDTSSAHGSFSLYTQTTTAGDVFNLFVQNIQGPRGYRLSQAAGTTFNLFRNGSVSGTAQGVLQDNGDRGGAAVDTTNPPAVTTSGTITLSAVAPALPSISISRFQPPGQSPRDYLASAERLNERSSKSPAATATTKVKQAASSVKSAWVIGQATPKASAAEVARIYRSEAPLMLSHHAVRSITKAFASAPNMVLAGETINVPFGAGGAVGTLPAGKSITIKYSATINAPPLARQVSTQGTVQGTNFATVQTDDPDAVGLTNPTITLIDTLMTWNGGTSTNWTTATNWTPPAGGTQYAPGVSNPAVNDVVIPNVGNQPNIPVGGGDIGLFSMSIANGRTLTIDTGRTLTIGGSPGGDLTVDGIISGGFLNLGTGAHIINNAGGTGSISATNLATVLSGSTVTLANNLQMGALAINAGGSMDISNHTLSLNGSGAALAVAGGGTFTTTGSTVVFNGTAAQQAGAVIAYNNLTINNTLGLNVTGVTLTGNATVNGTLTLTSSDLATGAFSLTQPNTTPTAPGGVSDVVGTVIRTAAFGTNPITFGNPNNIITFAAAGTKPTTLTVVLAKTAPATYATAVTRNYTITQSPGGTTSTSTLRLRYLDPTELNGNTEAALNLRRFRSVDSHWVAQLPSSVNTASNYVESNTVAAADLATQWTFSSQTPTASGGAITGRIVDDSGRPVEGAVVRLGGAQNRKFITDANGFYRFDNVETNGFYTVTPSRANYSFNPSVRSFSQLGESTEATFGATLATSTHVNPLDTPEYFVRQHYIDFLGREPDEAGFNFWSDQILGCGNDGDCISRKRENVSAAYFLSIEFQKTGGLVDGLYRASYGARPDFAQFMPDTRTVGQGVIVNMEGWEARLNANEEAFANAFVNRAAFHALYDGMDNSLFVDTLIGHTGVSFTVGERDALVGGLSTGTMTRAEALRSIAENNRFVTAKFNEAFVMMEYFGYLRRNADASGFQFWLDKLNQFGGNFEQAEMVKAFIVSGEYRDRFPR